MGRSTSLPEVMSFELVSVASLCSVVQFIDVPFPFFLDVD
jgi:hypothetical protein